MKVAFRTDASLTIGTGHVMRCLTLADAMRERSVQSTFICRRHSGHLLDLIRQRGHQTIELSPANGDFNTPEAPTHAYWLGTDGATDAQQTRQALEGQVMDWLVVDHYALERRWEQTMRPHARRVMVIDDLADRPHDCDLLLDQNLGRSEKDYSDLLNPGTQTLIGPQYALLRPEFSLWRDYSLIRRAQPQLKKLLITMGGVDKDNATGQVLDALEYCGLPADLQITVVMGPHAPWLVQVKERAATMPQVTQVLVGVDNMAQLMADSDLCIGAVGSTTWERCSLGLPCIQLVLADNQKEASSALDALQAALNVDISPRLASDLRAILGLTDAGVLKVLSKRSAAICDGSGTQIVCTHLMASSSLL